MEADDQANLNRLNFPPKQDCPDAVTDVDKNIRPAPGRRTDFNFYVVCRIGCVKQYSEEAVNKLPGLYIEVIFP